MNTGAVADDAFARDACRVKICLLAGIGGGLIPWFLSNDRSDIDGGDTGLIGGDAFAVYEEFEDSAIVVVDVNG